MLVGTKISHAEATEVMLKAGLQPLEPYPGGNTQWKSQCIKCEVIVFPRYSNIKNGWGGCAWCSRRKVKPENAILVMREAGLEPLEPYPGSGPQWKSRCTNCNVIVFPRYGNIRQGNGGCKKCGFIKSSSKNRTSEDSAIAEFEEFGFRPTAPFTSVSTPWKATHNLCGREVSPSLSRLRAGYGGCGYCAQKKVDVEEAIQFMKSKGLKPLVDFPGAKRQWPCECMICGGKCNPSYGILKTGKQKSGCWRCSSNPVKWSKLSSDERKSRIASTSKRRFYADQALAIITALNLEPLEPFKGLDAKWRCRCLVCNKEVSPICELLKSAKQKSGCPYCAGQKVDPTEAEDFMKTKLLLPLEPFPGSHPQWRCKCLQCDREVLPRYGNIKSGWGGCAWCSGQRINPEDATLLMRDAGLEPLEPYPGTQTPWKCRCLKCERGVTPTYLSVSHGGGCRYCATPGLNWQDKSTLYLLTSTHFMKVGIANKKTLSKRLRQHKRWGLEPVSFWEFETGDAAYRVEQGVVSWWRNELEVPSLERAHLPDGWTETANLDDVDIADTANYIDRLISELKNP